LLNETLTEFITQQEEEAAIHQNRSIFQKASNKIQVHSTKVTEAMQAYENRKNQDAIELEMAWQVLTKSNLPTYLDLCKTIQHEIYGDLEEYFCFRHFYIGQVIAGFLAYSGPGFIFSYSGRKYWRHVLQKYKIFLQVSLGIWTDEAVAAFDLLHNARQMSKEELDESMPNVIAITVASRAVLYQIYPILTIFSVYVLAVSTTPLFIRSNLLKSLLPDLIIMDAHDIAVERERKSQKRIGADLSDYTWMTTLQAVVIFYTESRAIQLVNSALILALSFLFLAYSPI